MLNKYCTSVGTQDIALHLIILSQVSLTMTISWIFFSNFFRLSQAARVKDMGIHTQPSGFNSGLTAYICIIILY